MVNATDCRSVSWGFDSLPRLRIRGHGHLYEPSSKGWKQSFSRLGNVLFASRYARSGEGDPALSMGSSGGVSHNLVPRP